MIASKKKIQDDDDDDKPKRKQAKSKGKAKVDLKFTKVPAKFFDPTTSGLKTTIKKGVNTYDIVIAK